MKEMRPCDGWLPDFCQEMEWLTHFFNMFDVDSMEPFPRNIWSTDRIGTSVRSEFLETGPGSDYGLQSALQRDNERVRQR